MSKAIRIHAHGGPEVLRYGEVDPGKPGTGEALIRHTAIGLNFLDVYYRTGLYPAPNGLPLMPGGEAAGVVLRSRARASTTSSSGDRVAYVVQLGAYAEERVIAADRLVKMPDDISDEQAAAMMLKGMTAEYLLRRTFKVKPGDTVLFHAAAGGVGLILGQWAKHLGATVIGTAGSAGEDRAGAWRMASTTSSTTARRISSRRCGTSPAAGGATSSTIRSARTRFRARWIA